MPSWSVRPISQLAQWISEGKLAQPVDSTYALAEITTALTRAMEDQRDGKVLLSCSQGDQP